MRRSMDETTTPGKILAVRVGRGGDLVMFTPALRLLLDAFPRATVDLWTAPEGPRTLYGFDARLGKFWVDPRRFPGAWLARARRRSEFAHERYDAAYVFETHPRYAALLRGTHTVVHAMPRHEPAGARVRHFADRCLDVVDATLPADRRGERPWASLPVTDAARTAAGAYLKDHGIHEGETLVGLHLTFSESLRGIFGGAKGRKHRAWSMSEAAKLARVLKDGGVRPIVDVLPRERRILAPFLAQAGDAVTVLSGPSDFERYKALLARLAVLVSPNTGPMHIAAAVGTPVVALFSGWDPADCGPYAPPARVRVLRAEDTSEPGLGLAAIPAAAAFAACREFLPR